MPDAPPEGTVSATAPEGGSATAVVNPPVMKVQTVEHTDASTLPELNWGWRRFYIFLVTEECVAAAAYVLWTTDDVTTLRMIARYALIGVGFLALLYMTGSGAEGLTKLIQAAKTTRKETTTVGPADGKVG